MIIIWSRNARKRLVTIDKRYRQRIVEKLSLLDDKSAPTLDVKKLSRPGDLYRLRVGEYRVIFTKHEEICDACYVLAVERRTTTTYLHEERAPYGRSVY
jgi:mRNA-degrading endonuclease RelE of RelBE toxin-antitoxin system